MVTVSQKQHIHHLTRDFDFDSWLSHISEHYSSREISLLKKAYSFMEGAITHQQDINGDTEFSRALRIAEILADLHLDVSVLVAALVHALLGTNTLSHDSIRHEFGNEVLLLVDGINKMQIFDAYQVHSANKDKDKSKDNVERVRKLLLALAEDVRVVLIKIAERLYTMRHLKSFADDVKRQIAAETMDIFAPLASRLGIWQVKWELEDLCFRYLDPQTYQHIAGMLDERRIDREAYIARVIQDLSELLSRAGIAAEVTGRPKHIYSIWRKMKSKGVGFEELFDVRATRVLVKSIADCYAALGVVHTRWRPIRGEFDDYIATPKQNDYQSLHTAVIGPDDKTVEVQIRTFDMHEHAEYGVAAHWGYKEGGRQDQRDQQKVAWLRQLLELKDDYVDPEELVEQFKSEVFADRVYVLTPKGQVVDLPKGATPLDFAYLIHTEIGHRFRGAKVDGKIVTIGYELKNGQQVEILTSKNSKPSRDWLNTHLNYCKTARTRAKIRAWFKQQDFENNVNDGRLIFERELHRLAIHDLQFEQIARRFKFEKVDDFFAAIGRNDITTTQIANAVNEIVLPLEHRETQSLQPQPRRSSDTSKDEIRVMGVDDLLSQTAKCCKPVPYDEIVGYITKNRGVTIHRRDCPNMSRLDEQDHERAIEVSWGQVTQERTYPVDIKVTAYDRQGLLRDITTILTNCHLNVIGVNTHTDKQSLIAQMVFTVEVSDADQLSGALTKIEHLQNIIEVARKHI